MLRTSYWYSLRDQRRGVEIERLVDGRHLAHPHELADDVGRLDAELVGEILHGDRFLHLDDALLRLRFGDLSLLISFPIGSFFLLRKENHFLLAVVGEAHVFGTDFGFAAAAAAFFRGFFLGHLVEVFFGHLDDAEAVLVLRRRSRLWSRPFGCQRRGAAPA